LKTIPLQAGDTRSFTFDTFTAGTIHVGLRYSNDNLNTMPVETLEVRIDGQLVAAFEAEDTGDFGQGWNAFSVVPEMGSIALTPGAHQLEVRVTGGDGYGVELDAVMLAARRPPADGTATVYGVGSSILHVPELVLPALWDGVQNGLLHPRFGFADAFNVDVADARSPFVDVADEEILRADGPWVHFNGFAIDHGPMAAMIQNYLVHQFTPRQFMSDANLAETLASLFPDYAKHWHNQRNPVDVNNDGYLTAVDALDGISEINRDGARRLALLPSLPVRRYFDVSGNGVLSALDILLIVNALNRATISDGEASPASLPVAEGEGTPAVAESVWWSADVIEANHPTSLSEHSPTALLAPDRDDIDAPSAIPASPKKTPWAAHDAVLAARGVSPSDIWSIEREDFLLARDRSAEPLGHPWALVRSPFGPRLV
jgi:hypothetical protein